MAHAAGISNENTVMACTVYFWARVAHPIVYWTGIPFTRTIAFTVGWVMMAWMFVEIINAMAPSGV
ncbi:MAPEG family protein [Alphaproteobacteria bacterium]|nr:MAPEG family protein [Alphaproteobacteria bacterium]